MARSGPLRADRPVRPGRAEQGDEAGAEADLRALLSLGVKLVRHSPNIRLMQYGHMAVDYGLDHLAVLRRRQGRDTEAVRLETIRAELPPREGCEGLMKTEMPHTASVPAGFAPVATVAARDDLPLAIRRNALQGIRLGYTSNPSELLFGPGSERIRLARRLGQDEALRVWWEDMERVRPPAEFRTRALIRMLL